ncbi:hypothetical protein VOLCADRAFT_92018 [Volvox carteri f. nagariensis]|uniref:Vacuolar ATPase assembly protein VMA22 n=1 Tax=Volvox carteri f. nagariensis TaxID=3068 RepID=D8TYW2_VOLCA|nr:uncharacterized protein VOLCADRAFT_92018 [Volvox carteri f. nagariensis]EFJ47286.1 hypothetical protein VOLCADRAFT_92018 [Volvox carteri f. nagariensis]|eukprot:XP_002951475.1 hypothetical protein VOLCADRAFT_92018 [Volvox carteri f. nagariensis]
MSASDVLDSDIRTIDLECAEREFVAAMDSIQEYMQLQAKLQGQLKQGLLSLARAKYSMGPIGQAQYDMDMKASVRVGVFPGAVGKPQFCSFYEASTFLLQRGPATAGRGAGSATSAPGGSVAGNLTESSNGGAAAAAAAAAETSRGGREGTVLQGGSSGVSTAAAVAPPPPAPPPAGDFNAAVVDELSDFSDDDEEEEGEEEGGLREAIEFLRGMRMQAVEASGDGGCGDGDVGFSGCGGGGGGGAAGQQRPLGRRRRGGRRGGGGGGGGARDPLHWFGVLVPPAMKEAQAQFSEGESEEGITPSPNTHPE